MAYKVGIVFLVLAGIISLAFLNVVMVARILWIVFFAAASLCLYTFARTDVSTYNNNSWVPKKNKDIRVRISQDDTVVEIPAGACTCTEKM